MGTKGGEPECRGVVEFKEVGVGGSNRARGCTVGLLEERRGEVQVERVPPGSLSVWRRVVDSVTP